MKRLRLSYTLSLAALLLSCANPSTTGDSGTPDVEKRLAELGITLPELAPPLANYVPAVQVGKMIYLAGKGPRKPDGSYIVGKVGKDLTVDEAYQAARLTAINQLAALKAQIGDLNRVKRIVRVTGYVHCTDDFTQQPQVINGFSDLLVEVFGDRGRHARSAIGTNALPLGIPVEIEMIVELK